MEIQDLLKKMEEVNKRLKTIDKFLNLQATNAEVIVGSTHVTAKHRTDPYSNIALTVNVPTEIILELLLSEKQKLTDFINKYQPVIDLANRAIKGS